MNQMSRITQYLLSLVSRGKSERGIASEPFPGNRPEDQIIEKGLLLAVGCLAEAMILQMFLYWTGRLWDFDQYLHDERRRREQEIQDELPESGWVEKTAEDLLRDLMPGASEHAIRIHLNSLVRNGFLLERENPAYPWEHTLQYRVNFIRLQKAMARRGCPLDESVFGRAAQMDIKQSEHSL
jgi:hypothetical protein